MQQGMLIERPRENVVLRPYQRAAVRGIVEAWKAHRAVLLVLPTGTGKTTVFAEVIRRCLIHNYRVLVLAHRDELIEQARTRIAEQVGYEPDKEKAADWASTASPCVVGSVQTMRGDRLTRWPADHFDLVIVDEAHHMAAQTYRDIADHFSQAKLLGVTATPDRADNKTLGRWFSSIAYQYSMVDAVREGFLVKIFGRRVTDFQVDLNQLRTVAGDFKESDLTKVVAEYVGPMCQTIERETADHKTLIFLPSVKASKLVAETLREQGLAAAFLSGKDSMEHRRDILGEFRRGGITHLANCGLFLEGFDEPSIEAVVMGRPTLSRTVYAQAVGRGTRPAPGKDHLLLVEFTYNYRAHKLVNAFELFAAEGYDERVRDMAEEAIPAKTVMGDDPLVDFFGELEKAHEDRFSVKRMLDHLKIKELGTEWFDPFSIADIAGVDISGEFSLEWNGRELKGPATEKQQGVLKKFGVYTPGLSKAQASAVIQLIADAGWSVDGLVDDAVARLRR